MNNQVRSLKRGLDILSFLSAHGGTKAGELARSLNLSRGTVYRLLQTLDADGYVSFNSGDQRFKVTNKAATLGDGFRSESELAEILKPLIRKYAKELIWPIDFLVYDNGTMVVIDSTHTLSPMSIDHSMVGRRVPLLRTAAGRAYLAHVSHSQQKIMVEQLKNLKEQDDAPFLDETRLSIMLQKIKAKGIAVRYNGKFKPDTAGLAVPLIYDGDVLGCISLIWIRKALSVERVLATCEEPIRALAHEAVIEYGQRLN
ncbi:helix-turn-helix domain-containing protein [Ochrobactrum sp. Q0168]|uniref:helix-turn-helix domain-containing protein n=1 Tax=Ochrobactrum sp. Q0168 TaxID=2793241 RepID=UPI0018EBBC41|nr:helix-turn-helix domain-containing protein [Ochrobactrum sp. Q0168]